MCFVVVLVMFRMLLFYVRIILSFVSLLIVTGVLLGGFDVVLNLFILLTCCDIYVFRFTLFGFVLQFDCSLLVF